MFNASEIDKGSTLVTLRWGYTINAILHEKKGGKNIFSTNKLDSTNVFNIDNNQKYLLNSKSAY